MNPKQLIQFSEDQVDRLVRFYSEAQQDIVFSWNRALLLGDAGQLEYLTRMRRNIGTILEELSNGNRAWSEHAIPEVYVRGLNAADDMLRELGLDATAGFGAIHQQAAQVLAENTYNRLNDVADFIGRRTEDFYRTAALENVRGSVIGYNTWQRTAENLRRELAHNGVTGFRDRANREWNMKSYVAMVARTTTMEAHLAGTTNRLLEQGHDLIKVSTHIGACELCAPWEGEILSLTGQTEGYPILDDAKVQGLFHPNCRHAYGLYIDLDKEIDQLE